MQSRVILVVLALIAPTSLAACEVLYGGKIIPDDAGDDAAVSDAGADTGADAGSFQGYCASLNPPPAFCEDFDKSTTLSLVWQQFTSAAARLSISQAESQSPPNALSVVLEPNDAGEALAYVSKPMTALAHVRLGFDLYVQVIPATGASELISFGPQKPNTDFGFGLWPLNGQSYVIGPGTSGFQGPIVGVPTGAWTRITLDFSAQSGNTTLDVYFRDRATKNVTHVFSRSGFGPMTSGVLVAGLMFYGNLTGKWAVLYDNVTWDGNDDGGALSPPP